MTEKDEALATLRELCPVGSTVYTNLRHVSQSGMSRVISVHVVKNGAIRDISYLVAKVTGFKLSNKFDGLTVGGAGMDMGFHVVYSLSRALYPDGHKCTGSNGYTKAGNRSSITACPSNDHNNDYGDFARLWDSHSPRWVEQLEKADRARRQAALDQVTDEFNNAKREYESLITERQEWIKAQLAKSYSRRRTHSDGGYALRHSWL